MTTLPTTALFCALELNRLLPERFQLSDPTLTRTMLQLEMTAKRELKRLLIAAWGLLGQDVPSSSMPPLDLFLDQLEAVWEAYRELDGTGDERMYR